MGDVAQTVLTVSVPTLAVLIGILVNNSRLSDTNKRIDDLRSAIDSRFSAEARVNEANFKMLLGKIEDVDTRLSRLEERFAR
jgi:hypothetical protein